MVCFLITIIGFFIKCWILIKSLHFSVDFLILIRENWNFKRFTLILDNFNENIEVSTQNRRTLSNYI